MIVSHVASAADVTAELLTPLSMFFAVRWGTWKPALQYQNPISRWPYLEAGLEHPDWAAEVPLALRG